LTGDWAGFREQMQALRTQLQQDKRDGLLRDCDVALYRKVQRDHRNEHFRQAQVDLNRDALAGQTQQEENSKNQLYEGGNRNGQK